MKLFKKLFVILVCLPLITFSQKLDSTKIIVDKFTIEGNRVLYVPVYDMPGKSKDSIKKIVLNKVATDSRLNLVQASLSEDQVSGSFKDLEINFRKYGYKWGNVTTYILHPMSADFVIQFKDDKYRVLIKNIKGKVTGYALALDWDDFIEKGKLEKIDRCLRSYYAFGKTMDEMFDVRGFQQKDW